MSEEVKDMVVGANGSAQAEEGPVKAEAAVQEPVETMEDFASELEASYKEFDQKRNDYHDQEGPDAQKWAYIDDIQGFIPASHISTKYVEKLEDWVGKYLEVVPITVDPERKKLVLSSRVVMKDKEEAQKAEKMASVKAGAVLEGVVDSLKDYGAFVDLDNGLTGLLHVSQISSQRIKHPGVVLKEGQKVTVKVIAVGDGRISLSMKALEAADEPKEEVFHYKETGAATTGLASLLKDIKL